MIEEQIALYEAVALRSDDDDRITRKRLEAMKEKLAEKLGALTSKHDDMVTLEEIGIDQIIVDEAQEFRKLSFATNQVNLKGVDPDGSQRAWDLFVKARYLDRKRLGRPGQPGRALILASGTPITNTLGEMYTLLRFLAPEALQERDVHAFDAWASAFGDTSTELELQPSGTYKPVTRFAAFINVADLMMMFRSVADVVQKTDLRGQITLPRIRGGERRLITAEASPAFKDYQQHLAGRIKAIEARTGRVLIGSSDTMGTGVNVQQRLKALHHLDVPWLPSQIEQREGRIERQGNQHDEIFIYAYATPGSIDATMWQNNERKARFIEAALSGDCAIRRLEDVGSQANQFAMAKAVASGDSRLMQKAGLELMTPLIFR